jgi:TM2 domain-containing membrane protein YozV
MAAVRQEPPVEATPQAAYQTQAPPTVLGAAQGQAAAPQIILPKNPALGVILSFFVPGLGSIVNGSTGRGVTILVVYVVGWILALFIIGIPILIGAWIWGLVDGYLSAQRWNQAHGIVS